MTSTICPTCGNTNTSGRFCSNCGTPTPAFLQEAPTVEQTIESASTATSSAPVADPAPPPTTGPPPQRSQPPGVAVRFCRTCSGDVSASPQRCPQCGADPMYGTHYCFSCRTTTDPFTNPCRTCGAWFQQQLPAAPPQPPYGHAPQPPQTTIVNNVGVGVVQPAGPPKSRATAALLCFFLGGLGIHRFYTGQTGLGLALLLQTLILVPLTLGLWLIVILVWVVIDFILILVGSIHDQYGRPLA